MSEIKTQHAVANFLRPNTGPAPTGVRMLNLHQQFNHCLEKSNRDQDTQEQNPNTGRKRAGNNRHTSINPSPATQQSQYLNNFTVVNSGIVSWPFAVNPLMTSSPPSAALSIQRMLRSHRINLLRELINKGIEYARLNRDSDELKKSLTIIVQSDDLQDKYILKHHNGRYTLVIETDDNSFADELISSREKFCNHFYHQTACELNISIRAAP